MPIKNRIESIFFIAIGLLAATIYLGVIYAHTINMPKWDDFVDILQFMNRWLDADSLSKKINIFFYHSNEHILLVNHIFTLAQYHLIHKINFTWLIYIGNLFYLASALSLFLFYKEHKQAPYIFAIIILLTVGFYSNESTLWAMTAISNQAVIFFSLLSIYFISNKQRLFACMASTGLAIFSQSNGFILIPLIGIYLFYTNKSLLLKWILFSLTIISIYTYFFNLPADQQTIRILEKLALKDYLMTIPSFLSAIGGFIFNQTDDLKQLVIQLIISSLIGILILLFFIKQLKNSRSHHGLILVIGFFLFTLVVIGFYRGLFAGPQIAFTSRYKMYPCYFLTTAVFLSPVLLRKADTKAAWRYGLFFMALIIFLISFPLNLPHVRLVNEHLRNSLQYWVEDGDFRRGKGYFIKDTDSYLFPAIHNQLWTPLELINPDLILHDVAGINTCPAVTTSEKSLQLDIKHVNRNAPGIRLELTISAEQKLPDPIILFLCSSSHSYALSLRLPKPLSRAPSTIFYIPAELITAETYELRYSANNMIYASTAHLIRKANTR